MSQGGARTPFKKARLSSYYFFLRNHGVFHQEGMLKLSRGVQGRPKTPKPIQGAANGTKNRTPHISPRTTRATPALSLQRILLASCLCLCFGRHHLQARHNKAAYHKPQTSSMRTESLITCLISRRFLQSNCHDVQLLLRLLRYSRQSDAPRSYRQKDISGNRSE